MTPRDAVLPVLDTFRGLLDTSFGLRRYAVAVVVNTWSGALVGEGTKTQVITSLVVAGGARPKVEQLTQRDVMASGGLYQDLDFRVGPLTPVSSSFPSVGVDPSTFDPAPVGANVEVLFTVTGPGMPNGAFFKKVSQEVARNFRFTLVLRKTGEQNG